MASHQVFTSQFSGLINYLTKELQAVSNLYAPISHGEPHQALKPRSGPVSLAQPEKLLSAGNPVGHGVLPVDDDSGREVCGPDW